MDPSKVSSVEEWPLPMNVKQLQLFIGFCYYYNRFKKKLLTEYCPINKALQKDAVYA